MKIYKISRTDTIGYDEFDSIVVFARSAKDAKTVTFRPDGTDIGCWCDINKVKVEYIGEGKKGSRRGIILASYCSG
jgi:hypothetical protein